MKNKEKRGISLIVLVITIIVIVILAVAVILSIANNNPIGNAKEATFKSDIKTIQEELELLKASNYAKNGGVGYKNPDGSEITIDDLSSVKGTEYENKLIVSDGILKYKSSEVTAEEIEYLESQGLTAGGYVLADGQDGVTIVDGYLTTNWNSNPDSVPEKDIEIPKGVTVIDSSSFLNCSEIESVIMSDDVKEIGLEIFSGCTSLKKVKFSSNLETLSDLSFCDCENLKNIELPNTLEYIGMEAFCNCKSLTSITIPEGVNSLSDGTFSGCSSLKEVKILSALRYLGTNVFNNCTSLTKLEIPKSVTTISVLAFSGCTSLTKLEIPKSVTTIYYDDSYEFSPFYGCTSLNEIIIEEGSPLELEMFSDLVDINTCSVRYGSLSY